MTDLALWLVRSPVNQASCYGSIPKKLLPKHLLKEGRKKEIKKERLWPQLQNTGPNHQTEQLVLYWFGTPIFANETWAPDLWLAQSYLITLNTLLLSFCVVFTQASFNCNQGLFCRVGSQKLNPLFHSVSPRAERCYWRVCLHERDREIVSLYILAYHTTDYK